jgi:hypothetical protein
MLQTFYCFYSYFATQLNFMRTTISKLLLVLNLIIAFSSCQKEVDYATGNGPGSSGGTGGTGNTNNIAGDYDFVGMVAHTQAVVTVNAQGQQLKAVTVSDYATKNNVGSVKITSNQIITSGLGYSIDTMMNVKTYIDNILLDDSDLPYIMSAPPSGSTSSYVRNSADSITVTGALGVPDPSGNTPSGPVGFKLAWSGDTLLLKMNTSFTQSVTQSGVPGILTGSVNGITKLKKR